GDHRSGLRRGVEQSRAPRAPDGSLRASGRALPEGARRRRELLPGGLQPGLAPRGPGRLRLGHHLVSPRAGARARLCRCPLQPGRGPGEERAERGRGPPLAALPRTGPGQSLGPDRPLPPGRHGESGGGRMRVLVIGGGGREHALVWKLAQSPRVSRIFAAPGNAGIARHADCIALKDTDIEGLVAAAARERVDLTVVGPELPLALGLADRFLEARLHVFGPSAAAARLESSKIFAKDFMARHGIPTARFRAFSQATAARGYCRELGAPLVV